MFELMDVDSQNAVIKVIGVGGGGGTTFFGIARHSRQAAETSPCSQYAIVAVLVPIPLHHPLCLGVPAPGSDCSSGKTRSLLLNANARKTPRNLHVICEPICARGSVHRCSASNDGDAAGRGFIGLDPNFGCFDAVVDGVAQQVNERCIEIVEDGAIEFDVVTANLKGNLLRQRAGKVGSLSLHAG